VTLAFLDTETLGLDPTRNSVWEIAYAIDAGPIRSAVVPHATVHADPEALAMAGDRRTHVRPDAAEWEAQARRHLAGATIVGANPAFDAAFLRARWDDAPWHYRLLDIEAYAMPALGLTRPQGLATIAEQLRVVAPDHTAAGDVACVRECYWLLTAHYRAAANGWTRLGKGSNW
jgi:hypothetical protein